MESKEKIKKFGEFYTPIGVVNYILDSIGYIPKSNIKEKFIIDPACGEGIFLVEVVKRIVKDFELEGFDLTKPDNSKRVLETIFNNVYGIDINYNSCEKTKKNLFSSVKILYETVKKKYKNYPVKFKIFCFDSLLPNQFDNMYFDYVIGNPPYIRIQRIKPESLRNRYKELYESAVGRFDSSVIFIERGIKWLKPSGVLGFIVSNKFLTTNYGEGIRNFILKSSSIKQIVNLTDVEPFQVSVLPCILILKNEVESSKYFHYCIVKKTKKELNARMVSDFFKFIKEHINEHNFSDFVDINFNGNKEKIIAQSFDAEIPPSKDIWFFIPPNELEVAKKISNLKTHTLGELSEKINVGIKTTANSVFANLVTKEFIERNSFEEDIIHPCLRGTNIKRWKTEWNGDKEKKETFLIYPHKRQNNRTVPINLDDYPHIKKFFESHKKELSKRDYLIDSGREWYEVWVHQNPDDFDGQLKILTSDLSSNNMFTLDKNRFFCLDSCYYIILREKSEDQYKFTLGLLNSKVIEFIHKRVASTYVYSNKYRYMTSYMRDYPINFKHDGLIGNKIIETVNEIIIAVNGNKPKEIVQELENQLDKLVYQLYQLDETEQNIIENALTVW
jgi:tRNA1(Val) A37 N6-methylase TrmN6